MNLQLNIDIKNTFHEGSLHSVQSSSTSLFSGPQKALFQSSIEFQHIPLLVIQFPTQTFLREVHCALLPPEVPTEVRSSLSAGTEDAMHFNAIDFLLGMEIGRSCLCCRPLSLLCSKGITFQGVIAPFVPLPLS